jgi:hypothetical protein
LKVRVKVTMADKLLPPEPGYPADERTISQGKADESLVRSSIIQQQQQQ